MSRRWRPAPTTRCAEPSGGSAPTRPSSPWRASSTDWPSRWGSPVGRCGTQRGDAGRGVGAGPDHGRWRRRGADVPRGGAPRLRRRRRRGQGGGAGAGTEELGPGQRVQGDRRSRRPARRGRRGRGPPLLDRDGAGDPHRGRPGRRRGTGGRPHQDPGGGGHHRELGAGQTTGSRGTLMGAGAVAAACRAAKEAGMATGVDHRGEYRVDWTNSIKEGLEHPVVHSTFGYAAQVVVADPVTGSGAGDRRPRRRPGGEPSAVRGPDRGLGAHGARLRPHRGLPHR